MRSFGMNNRNTSAQHANNALRKLQKHICELFMARNMHLYAWLRANRATMLFTAGIATFTTAPRAEDASYIEALTVSLGDQSANQLTPQMLDFIINHGYRTNYIAEKDVTPKELSLARCGSDDSNNINTIDSILRQYPADTFDGRILKEGAVVALPPCLPTKITEFTPRIALPGDSIDRYYRENNLCGDCITGTYPNEIQVLTPAAISTENLDKAKAGLVTSELQAPGDRSVEAYKIFERAFQRISESESPEVALAAALVDATPELQKDKRSQATILSTLEAASKTFAAMDIKIDIPPIPAETTMSGRTRDTPIVLSFDQRLKSATRPSGKLKAGEIVYQPIFSAANTVVPIDTSTFAGSSPEDRTATARKTVNELQGEQVTEVYANVVPFSATVGECQSDPTSSFVNPNLVMNAVARTLFHAGKTKEERWTARTTTVLILDHGLAIDKSAQLSLPFKTGLIEAPTVGALEQLPDSPHGVAVTGVALGGPDLWPILSSLNVHFKSENIYLPSGDGGSVVVPKKFRKRLSDGWDILNLSFGEKVASLDSAAPLSAILEKVSRDRLVIIAAGNDGTLVEELLYYPQRANQFSKRSYIVVGAADGMSRYSQSNYSSEVVDLYAPGCGIGSWLPNGDVSSFSGTSFAAPIVTFTASILHALEPEKFGDGKLLKSRILASADNIPSLFQFGQHGRYLNLIKALSLYQDVIQTDSELIYGQFEQRTVSTFCENSPSQRIVLKFGRNLALAQLASDAGQIGYYTAETDGELVPGFCTAKKEVKFRREGESDYVMLKMAEIVDAVTVGEIGE